MLLGQRLCIHPENIEIQEEKESGSVETKLNCHLVIESRLIKRIGGNYGVMAIVV